MTDLDKEDRIILPTPHFHDCLVDIILRRETQ